MKDFFPPKVWAKNVGVHYTQEHIIRGKIWATDVEKTTRKTRKQKFRKVMFFKGKGIRYCSF